MFCVTACCGIRENQENKKWNDEKTWTEDTQELTNKEIGIAKWQVTWEEIFRRKAKYMQLQVGKLTCKLLSSRCILNMKRLVTLKYKQRETSKASQESDLEVCQRFHGIAAIGINMGTPKVASPNVLSSKRMKLEQSKD